MNNNPLPHLLTVHEAAQALRKHPDTIRHVLSNTGSVYGLQPVRIGKRVYLRRYDVMRLIG